MGRLGLDGRKDSPGAWVQRAHFGLGGERERGGRLGDRKQQNEQVLFVAADCTTFYVFLNAVGTLTEVVDFK